MKKRKKNEEKNLSKKLFWEALETFRLSGSMKHYINPSIFVLKLLFILRPVIIHKKGINQDVRYY